MAFTSTKELTVQELVALAFVEYRHKRFVSSKLTTYVCALLAESFKVRSVQMVDEKLRIAESVGLIQSVPGPRGGPGFQVSALGAATVADVELPSKQFEHRADLDEERSLEANANPGPILVKIFNLLPPTKSHERNFISSVLQHWLTHGWLSSKQVGKIAYMAMEHGEFLEPRHYVGNSLAEWRAPYIEEQKRKVADQRAVAQALAAKREDERKERERVKALIKEGNGKVKAALKKLELAGDLDQLESLVTTVFPTANMSPAAKAVAFAGHGSKELRVCISAIAFGKPPALVWEDAGSARQPDANSDLWQCLVIHPAYLAINESR